MIFNLQCCSWAERRSTMLARFVHCITRSFCYAVDVIIWCSSVLHTDFIVCSMSDTTQTTKNRRRDQVHGRDTALLWHLSWETTCLEGPRFWAESRTFQYKSTCHKRPPVLRDQILWPVQWSFKAGSTALYRKMMYGFFSVSIIRYIICILLSTAKPLFMKFLLHIHFFCLKRLLDLVHNDDN